MLGMLQNTGQTKMQPKKGNMRNMRTISEHTHNQDRWLCQGWPCVTCQIEEDQKDFQTHNRKKIRRIIPRIVRSWCLFLDGMFCGSSVFTMLGWAFRVEVDTQGHQIGLTNCLADMLKSHRATSHARCVSLPQDVTLRSIEHRCVSLLPGAKYL